MKTPMSKILVLRKALPKAFPKAFLCALGLLLASSTLAAAAWGQSRYVSRQAGSEDMLAERAPVAARISSPGHDEARPPASQRAPEELRQAISLRVEGVALVEALRRIAEESDLDLIYGSHPVLTRKKVRKKVTLRLEDVTVREALEAALRGSGLEIVLSRSGRLILVKTGLSKITPRSLQSSFSGRELMQRAKAAALAPAVPQAQTGTIAGTVTDSTSGEPLPGVNVVIESTQQGAATDAQGAYEIAGVEAGTYTLRASFVGYGEETREGVEVTDGETTTVDFVMQSQAAGLDELVVVG